MASRVKIALSFALLAMLPRLQASENASKAEVLAAIQAAEASRGRPFPKGSCESDLQVGASLPQTGAGLVVTSFTFDPALGQVRFLLRSKDDRKAPPFYAWCSYQVDGTPSGSESSIRVPEKALGPVLVDVHRAARLYLHSPNGAAVLTVKPLQSGRQDERVRVRLPLHGKMLEARVIGPDALEAAF